MAAPDPQREILDVLERQVADWNRGDVRAFVSSYAEDTVFVSDHVTRGSAQLLERYLKRYPTRAAMGRLTFSDLEVRMLGPDHAYAIGKWKLDREAAGGGPVGGVFSLVLERRSGAWKIILDHTT